MSYKIIACDLDETLLNDYGQISLKNKEAIEKLPIYGIKFIIATGRTYKSALPFYKELNLKTPLITTGGAQVYDHDGNVIYSNYLKKEKVAALLRYGIERGLHVHTYIGDKFIYPKENEHSRYYANFTKLEGIEDPDILNRKIEASKVIFITDPPNVAYEVELIKKAFPELDVLRSKDRLIEVYTRGVSKGAALKKATELMGFHRDEVVAAGDSTIDLSMLKYAALSAAPETSLLEVKANVDIILPGNNEDAISELIERYILR